MKLESREINVLVKDTLDEDLGPGKGGSGDITTRHLIPPTQKIVAKIVCRTNGIICGLPLARQVFKTLDRKCTWRAKYSDGNKIKKGRTIAVITGLSRAIFAGERTALNFLQHLSGIATLTRKFVDKVKNTDTEIYDTRKTTPGLRLIEKYAVECGGGCPHRMGLYDMILIKDNHLKACRLAGLPTDQLIYSLPSKISRGSKIELEAQILRHVELGLACNVDIIMLDNMKLKTMKRAVSLIRKRKKPVEIEISGRVNLKNINKIVSLKADRISIGMLTHSAPVLDIALEIC